MKRAIQLVLPLIIIQLISISCSSEKGDRENTQNVTFVDPTDPSSNGSEGSGPDGEETTIAEDVVIEENKSFQIEASDQQTLINLTFKASDEFQEGRYLSEHVLVIQANEESCFKLEVRSDVDALEDVLVNPEQLESGEFCRGKRIDEVLTEETDEGGAADDAQEEGDDNDNQQAPAALTLMSEDPEICHQRLFRLKTREADELGDLFGLEPVVSKTAWLVYKTPTINVWADAEIGNPCFGGAVTSRGKTKLLLENLYPSFYTDARDQVMAEHYQNIGAEAAKIYARLTSLYGPVSDVNANGAVDILISPEVNRLHFSNVVTYQHDAFSSGLIVKPQDLDAFDHIENPDSNESEVVYLWSSDPAGLYKYSQYPTANSLTSNYQKGYVAQQIMSLIIANARMVTRKLDPEELWLTQGLSLLASAYMAGNDYSFQYLAEYLSTRHNYLGLTQTLNQGDVAKAFQSRLGQATVGYRAMFAWFLHTKLCGEVIQPCQQIKELVDTDLHGIQNVEAVIGQPFIEILSEFGHSVAVEMAPDKEQVKTILSTPENAAGLIFHAMPALQEVYPNEIPQTYEQDISADAVAGSADDRAFAGPFPGRDTIFFQPVMPDSNINLRLAKNSVTYVILTGLIRKETITTAFIGKDVSVTTIPIGNRKTEDRQIHIEKTSEMAHLDQRPVNLSSQVDAGRTYYSAPEYSSSYQVNKNRDLWIIGSIDNFNVNLAGATTAKAYKVGDVDSYNIEVDPCQGEDDETACRAEGTRTVLVQVVPRDFEKELTPSILVTQTSLEMFRASRFLSRLEKIDESIFAPDETAQVYHVGCYSTAVYQSTNFPSFNACANAGLTPELYQTAVCDNFPEACIAGMPSQAISFNAYTSAFIKQSQPTFIPSLYDNFFHSGPEGFPFYTNYTIRYPDDVDIIRAGPRPFINEEINRQFFNFAYSRDIKARTYQVHPLFAGVDSFSDINLDPELKLMNDSSISALEKLKSDLETTDTLSEEARQGCTDLGFTDIICSEPYLHRELLTSAAKEFTSDKRVRCVVDLSVFANSADSDEFKQDLAIRCPGGSLTQTSDVFNSVGETVDPWLDASKFIVVNNSPSATYRTFYNPMFPEVKQTSSYCLGNAEKDLSGAYGIDYPPCTIEPSNQTANDIRTQLNMPAGKFTVGCTGDEFAKDFLACGDVYSYYLETNLDNRELGATYNRVRFVGQRTRSFTPFAIARSAGEYIGKQEQLHYVSFKVPTAQSSVINVMVGGLQQSQGKYILRVKTKNLSQVIRH